MSARLCPGRSVVQRSQHLRPVALPAVEIPGRVRYESKFGPSNRRGVSSDAVMAGQVKALAADSPHRLESVTAKDAFEPRPSNSGLRACSWRQTFIAVVAVKSSDHSRVSAGVKLSVLSKTHWPRTESNTPYVR